MSDVRPGGPAPSFRAPDSTGRVWTNEDLVGKPYVVTFYPKDETPGCVAQVCSFRDAWSAFEERGVRVFGVSRDSVEDHAAFVANRKLPYTLLSDPDATLHKAFGVGRLFGVTRRKSYLVDAEGRVADIYESNLEPSSHAEAMLKALTQLSA